MHYFHNMSSASGGKAPRHNRGPIPGPRQETRPQNPRLPIPEKKILRGPMLANPTSNPDCDPVPNHTPSQP